MSPRCRRRWPTRKRPKSKQEWLADGVLYWRLTDFYDDAATVKKSGEKLRRASRVVLDLRDNPGGSAGVLLRIAGFFAPPGTPVVRTVSRGTESTLVTEDVGEPFAGTVAVLVDARSGSSAEILARLLQLRGARVIGDRTVGAVLKARLLKHAAGDGDIKVLYGGASSPMPTSTCPTARASKASACSPTSSPCPPPTISRRTSIPCWPRRPRRSASRSIRSVRAACPASRSFHAHTPCRFAPRRGRRRRGQSSRPAARSRAGGGQAGRQEGRGEAQGAEVGRHRRVRPDVQGRLRHERRHLDERRRQPGRGARRVRPARRSLRDADRRIDGGGAGDAAHDRAGVRHAAALQPGRQADRLHQRSRRPVQHLGDGRRRQEPDRRVARGEVVGEQPDLGAGRRLHLRPQALRVDAVARRRRGVDVSTAAAPTASR